MISPDAGQIAAVIADSTAEGGQSHIWLLGADGKAMRQVTVSTADTEPGERAPAWAPDGTALYFLAKRGKAERLYRLPLVGGEAQALTLARPAAGAAKSGWNLKAEDTVDAPAKSYDLSPDGKWIALVASDGETAARAAEVKKKDDAVRVGKDDQNQARLYLVEAATGQAREVGLPDNVQSARWNAKGDEPGGHHHPGRRGPGPRGQGLADHAAATGSLDPARRHLPKTIRQPAFTPTGLSSIWPNARTTRSPGCAEGSIPMTSEATPSTASPRG